MTPGEARAKAAGMKTSLIGAIAAAAIGCGGAKSDSTATAADPELGQRHEVGTGRKAPMGGAHQKEEHGQTGETGEKGEHDEMAGLPPQLAKFHDTLAPRWHAKPGPQRMTDTCAAMPQFHADADAIAAAQPPSGGDASAWSTGGKQLTEAVAALDATCSAHDAAAFEPAFEKVHNSFHGLMEAAGGHAM